MSKAWDQATTDAALETAGYVVAHVADLAGVSDGAKDREPRLRDFCRQAFHRRQGVASLLGGSAGDYPVARDPVASDTQHDATRHQ